MCGPVQQLGDVDGDEIVDRGQFALGEAFQRAGYATAGFMGSDWLAEELGYGRGFEHYDDLDAKGERRADDIGDKVMAFLGLFVVPAGAVAVANYHVFEGVKDVDGCLSCHVMRPMGTDLRDPHSDTLAARQARIRPVAPAATV